MSALPPDERARFLASLVKLEAQARRLFKDRNGWKAMAGAPETAAGKRPKKTIVRNRGRRA